MCITERHCCVCVCFFLNDCMSFYNAKTKLHIYLTMTSDDVERRIFLSLIRVEKVPSSLDILLR